MVPCTSRSVYVLPNTHLHSATRPLWHLQNEQQGSAFLRLRIPHFRQLQWIANSLGIGCASIFGVRTSSASSNPYCVGSRRSCVVDKRDTISFVAYTALRICSLVAELVGGSCCKDTDLLLWYNSFRSWSVFLNFVPFFNTNSSFQPKFA